LVDLGLTAAWILPSITSSDLVVAGAIDDHSGRSRVTILVNDVNWPYCAAFGRKLLRANSALGGCVCASASASSARQFIREV
jgi:hypothetical protein